MPSNNPLDPNIPKTPPITPPTPAGPAPAGNDSGLSNSPFARMFPEGATPQELRQFINNFLKMMIVEFKQSDESWQQSQERMKKIEQGEDPD